MGNNNWARLRVATLIYCVVNAVVRTCSAHKKKGWR